MPQYPKQIFFVLFLLLFLCRCAQVGVLNGGKRNNNPPKLVKAIPASGSLNFDSKEVVLQFDEFVQLKDLPNQLIVSPRIKTSPEIETEGKKIRITLKKEELSPNTTYRLAFDNSIV